MNDGMFKFETLSLTLITHRFDLEPNNANGTVKIIMLPFAKTCQSYWYGIDNSYFLE